MHGSLSRVIDVISVANIANIALSHSKYKYNNGRHMIDVFGLNEQCRVFTTLMEFTPSKLFSQLFTQLVPKSVTKATI